MNIMLADTIQLLRLYSELSFIDECNGLESYWAILEKKGQYVMQQKRIFLDSGAFSAWTKDVKIDIDEYVAFIKKYQRHLEIYAVLDVIGDPEGTYSNQKYMEAQGLKPLPCYHYGSSIDWLLMYLEEDYDYIALGGMVPVPTRDLRKWLDDVFGNYLVDSDGWPVVKIHGFGMTSVELMLRYPWYSVDSTSWVLTSRFGGVYVPPARDGRWVYDVAPHKISVSDKSGALGRDMAHFSTLPSVMQEAVLTYFNEKKVAYEELASSYRARDILNIRYFLDFERNYVVRPFKLKRKGFGL